MVPFADGSVYDGEGRMMTLNIAIRDHGFLLSGSTLAIEGAGVIFCFCFFRTCKSFAFN